MDSESWTRFSRRRQASLQSRFDSYSGFEDIEPEVEEDDPTSEYACPFCMDQFDIVELFYHINEEHPVEAKNGVCPVCATKVGMDLVGHITSQHGNFFKMNRQRRVRRGTPGHPSTLAFLRKELRDGNLQSLLEGSYLDAPSSTAPDPLLSSFITSLPVPDMTKDVQPDISSEEGDTLSTASTEKATERIIIEPVLSEKDQEERALRCKFAQGLILSTIFDDDVL